MEIFKAVVDSEMENMRIDRYLKKVCNEETLSKIFKAIRKGDVKVNEKKIKENYRLSLNDIITIKYLNVSKTFSSLKFEENNERMKNSNNNFSKFSNAFEKNKYEKMIVFENDDFFIVNKPDNIPMHKGTGHEYGLSEIYKNIFKNENINFANRLDYETSGLVIGCKTKKFLRYISEKIRNNEVEKRYIAVVHGKAEDLRKKEKCENRFTIKNYLMTTENGVKVVNKNTEKAKESISNFTILEDIPINTGINQKTVLEVELITGRKHQIRVQLSNRGYPIIGDRKYGIKDNSKKFYLCCYKIAFDNYNFDIKEKVFK